uniref:Uncharacterized protein n=1 Tax=Arion vulgaris TaxID=1028688 RepID=A0A0B6YES4_9EUPU
MTECKSVPVSTSIGPAVSSKTVKVLDSEIRYARPKSAIKVARSTSTLAQITQRSQTMINKWL